MNWIETFRAAAANPSRDGDVVVPVAALRDALAFVAAHAQARRDPCTCGHGVTAHSTLGCGVKIAPGQVCRCWRYEATPADDETLRDLLRQTTKALRANLGNYLTASAADLLRRVDAALADGANQRPEPRPSDELGTSDRIVAEVKRVWPEHAQVHYGLPVRSIPDGSPTAVLIDLSVHIALSMVQRDEDALTGPLHGELADVLGEVRALLDGPDQPAREQARAALRKRIGGGR